MTTLQQAAPAAASSSARASSPGPRTASWLHGGAAPRLTLALACSAALWTSVVWALSAGG